MKQGFGSLIAEEAQYIAHYSSDLIQCVNAAGRLVYVNARWQEVLGYTNEALSVMTVWDIIHPDSLEHCQGIFREVMAGRPVDSVSAVFRASNGDSIHVGGRVTCRLDDKGAVISSLGIFRDVTAQVRVEEALQDSENRLRTLVDIVGDGIVLQDSSGRILYWNQAADNLLGVQVKDSMEHSSDSHGKRTIREDGSLLPAEEHPSLHTLRTGEPCNNVVIGVLRSNAETKWIMVNTRPLFKAGELKPDAVAISFSDITQRKKDEEALAKSNETLATLNAFAAEQALCPNPAEMVELITRQLREYTDAVFVAFNDYVPVKQAFVLRRVAIERKELDDTTRLIGKKMLKLETPVSDHVYSQLITETVKYNSNLHELTGGAMPIMVARVLQRGLGIQDIIGLALVTEGQVFAAMAFGLGKNRSAPPHTFLESFARLSAISLRRVQAAEDLRQSEEAARRQADRLRIVNEIGTSIAGELNLENLLQLLYEQCQKIGSFSSFYVGLYEEKTGIMHYPFYYSHGKRVSRSTTDLNTGAYMAKYVIDSRKTIYLPDASLRPDGMKPTAITPYPSKTKSYIGVPLVAGGNPLGILTIQSDEYEAFTTEQIGLLDLLAMQVATAIHNSQLYEQVNHEKRLAEEANNAKQQFLANMSHEIRTPMNGFMGMLQLLERTKLNEVQQDYVKVARTSSEMLLRTINDILDFSKLEAGKIQLESVPMQVREVVADSIAIFAAAANAKGISLDFWVEADVPLTVRSDPYRLRQILTNVVGNAVKFTESGRVAVNVSLQQGSKAHELKLCFEVSDTGIGIAEDKLEGIFEGFSQADASNTRQYGGTGLGLPIAKGLVEAMGGEIWIESVPGKGTRVHLTCQVRTVAANHGIESHSAKEANIVSTGQSVRVLLVEDDDVSLQFVLALAQQKGWDVTIAKNGAEAVEKHRTASFDAILMDLQMPLMDGYAATRLIREAEKDAGVHTPIIAMTGRALKGDKEKCLQAGMDDYIAKPIDVDALYLAVDEAYRIAREV